MNLLAPKYYKDFVCIADRCKHSCCIGWEIDVDEKTITKYSSLEGEYGATIRNSIDYTDTPHFKLAENERCPHLNEKGLCNIILNCGEECLCDICREHPRFYNFTNAGKEVGLGMSCEAACKLILSSDDFDEFVILSEDSEPTEIIEFDAAAERTQVYKIIKSNGFLASIEIISEKYEISVDEGTVLKALGEIEYLTPSHKELFRGFSTKVTCGGALDAQLLRVLAYFIYRHCSEAWDYDGFRVSLAFSLACTYLIASLSNKENIYEIARTVSEEIEYSESNVQLLLDKLQNTQTKN